MKALVVEEEVEVAELQRLVALVEAGVAALARKWEEEVAEEEGHLLQAVVALVSRCLVGEVEEQEGQNFHSVPGLEVEVVVASSTPSRELAISRSATLPESDDSVCSTS